MPEKLRRLYNTLATIETKGANTIIMADCLRYLEQMIAENSSNQAEVEAHD